MSGASPGRACAFRVLRRVSESGAFADRALHAEAAGLDPRDRGLAMLLAYGAVQRRRTLDHVLAQLCSRPLERLDPPVLAALRLGAFELLFVEGAAEHAAVNESVELVKATGRGGAAFVNAVLRRVAREGRGLLDQLSDETPEGAAIVHSVPDWLAELWWRELGPAEARELLACANRPAESALRINALRAPLDLPLPVSSGPAGPELPEGRVLHEPFDVFGSEEWRNGLVMPQSRGSMLVARMLAPQPGERVLDLCAAPGGKTTHLAALMGGEGELVAVEVHPGRAAALAQTCARMGAGNVEVSTRDGRELDAGARFERVLVDPPCSGLGTLQSRPDLRWQDRRGQIGELVARQAALLRAGAAALAPGGTLVYSVCTISRAEGGDLVARFIAEGDRFELDDERQLLPHRDGTDGFYIARIRRRQAAPLP
jgi:16S rRNA (cytosine967-C5)-methyltransferase